MPEGILELIDLDIDQLGYKKFISSWLYKGSEGNFLVDVGPACTIPILLKALEKRGVHDLDWVLLTHIHQDHAGGLGNLLEKYPDALVVTHENGAAHLVDPTKLLEASRKILGEVSYIYGNILPVPQKNVKVKDEIPFGSGIKVIPTPGHASHHQCYVFQDWFFAGELFGAYIPMNKGLYLRPATPQRFILDDYLESMRLVEKELTDTICFAHYGMANNSRVILDTAKKQLKLWVQIINENRDNFDIDDLIEILLDNDKTFALYDELDPKMQAREKHFSINSIEGMLEYLDSKKM